MSIIIFVLIVLLPFMYWLGSFNKDNEIRAFLSSSRFKDTNYREWKEYTNKKGK